MPRPRVNPPPRPTGLFEKREERDAWERRTRNILMGDRRLPHVSLNALAAMLVQMLARLDELEAANKKLREDLERKIEDVDLEVENLAHDLRG